MARNDEWPEARKAKLIELWNEGVTTPEIARRMGLSKDAVIGKVHRLKLPARRRAVAEVRREREINPPKPKPLQPGERTLPLLPSEGGESHQW